MNTFVRKTGAQYLSFVQLTAVDAAGEMTHVKAEIAALKLSEIVKAAAKAAEAAGVPLEQDVELPPGFWSK